MLYFYLFSTEDWTYFFWIGGICMWEYEKPYPNPYCELLCVISLRLSELSLSFCTDRENVQSWIRGPSYLFKWRTMIIVALTHIITRAYSLVPNTQNHGSQIQSFSTMHRASHKRNHKKPIIPQANTHQRHTQSKLKRILKQRSKIHIFHNSS